MPGISARQQFFDRVFDRQMEREHAIAFVWRLIEPDFPDIVDRFYAHPGVAGLFEALGFQQSEDLKRRQTAHWRRVFTQRDAPDFRRECIAAARAHFRIGLSASLYVTAYHMMWRMIADHLGTLRLPPDRLVHLLDALQEALMEDMAVTLAAYELHEVD